MFLLLYLSGEGVSLDIAVKGHKVFDLTDDEMNDRTNTSVYSTWIQTSTKDREV